MSGRAAKAARRAAAGQTTTGRPSKVPPVQAPKRRDAPPNRGRLAVWALLVVAAGVVGLYAVTQFGNSGSATGGSGDYPYAVGSPGPGEQALPLVLPSTTGTEFDLAAHRGKDQVLLFFQEGLVCQPCWDQMKAIERDLPKFRALGVGPIVAVTTDPVDLTERKLRDEGIRMPVLADLGGEFSTTWETNRYQMMGMGAANGHSFILVGKDGKIVWRADYGGAPKYTMFLPVDALLRDLEQGIAQQA